MAHQVRASVAEQPTQQVPSEHNTPDHDEMNPSAGFAHSRRLSLTPAPSTIRSQSISIPALPDFNYRSGPASLDNLRYGYGQGRGFHEPSGPSQSQQAIDPIKALLESHNKVLESNNMIARLLADQISNQTRPTFDRTFKGPKACMPDTFNGDRTKVNNFITLCELYLSLRSNDFHGDQVAMIRWMVALLRDTALNAVQPYLNHSAPPDWLTEKVKFIEYLRSTYDDPDERRTAERKLRSLVQKGSAAKYFSEFRKYSAILGWDDGPLISLAIRGLTAELSEQLKDLLAQRDHPVKTLPELINIAIRLDDRRRWH